MLKTLIKKEIATAVIDMRFVIAALLCVILIPLGMYVSGKDYELRLSAYQREHQEYRQRYSNKVRWNVEAQGLRPPSILSIFASGIEPFMPDKVMTARSGLFRTVKEPIADNPHSFLFGKADFLFNVGFIVSLMALIFTFNSISGEKETGTLRLMIANSVPRNQILLTKVVGNYIALLIPFIVSVLIALLVLDISPYVSVASFRVWPAFLVIIGVTFLFILVMVSLGICISSFTLQSIDSIVLAFFVWATLVLAVPKVSPMVADILYPVESASVFDSNKRMIAEDIDHELVEEREALRIKCFDEYGAPESDMRSSRPMTDEGKKANAKFDREFAPIAERYQKRMANELRQIEQDYMRRKNIRSSIAMNLSRVSPICSYTYILCELSGTGVTEPDNFTRNAQRYQDRMKQDIYDKIIVKRRRHGASFSRVEGFDQSKAILPDMIYTYPTVTQALQTSRLDILLLGLFAVLFCSLAFMRLNKYDMR